MSQQPNIECVVKSRSRLGEGAFWDTNKQCLWWVDITAGIINRFEPTIPHNFPLPFRQPVGCVAPRAGGGLIVAAKSGFWFYNTDIGKKEKIADPEEDKPDNRFNDGTTDMQGRLWAGTMKDGGTPERAGRFYRVDPDLTVTPWRDGIFTTNGLAFSPDGKTMYFSDSNPGVRTIWACDYDTDTGTPGEPRVFFDTRAVAGRPDGGTVDADGCYWMAGVGGWQIYRITPEGKLDRTIDVPVEKPTKPMFGGPNLDTLYLTSIGDGVDRTNQPDAGGLFAITGLGVQGVPQAPFAG